MPLEVACPHCQSRLNLNTKPGEQCRCPMCHQVFLTPQPAPTYATSSQGVHPTYAGAPGAYKPISGLAIASMVLGIVGVATVCVWFLSIPCGIIAVILGAIAMNECNGPNARSSGAGMAVAGLACGAVSVGLWLIMFLLAAFSLSAPFSFRRW